MIFIKGVEFNMDWERFSGLDGGFGYAKPQGEVRLTIGGDFEHLQHFVEVIQAMWDRWSTATKPDPKALKEPET